MASKSINITDYNKLPGIVSETKKWYMFPTVSSKTKKDADIFWRIMVGVLDTETGKYMNISDSFINNERMDPKYEAIVRVESGHVGGKIKDAPDTVVHEGKNIGKSNETNVFCQALRDAFSKYNKQLDKTTISTDFVRPMLAKKLEDIKVPTWPMFIQCKFDGNRAMTRVLDDRTIGFYSRNLKSMENVPDHICHDICKLYSAAGAYFVAQGMKKSERTKLFFDGEIYSHGKSLQSLGYLRKKDAKADDDINSKYYVYDLYLGSKPDMIYSDRLDILRGIFSNFAGKAIVPVDTYVANNMKEAKKYYNQFLADQYEGAILRVPGASYDQSVNSYHSPYLLKMKPRLDAEFEIVGMAGGESSGKEEGAIMLNCITEGGKTFTVQPAMPLDERKELFKKYTENPKAFRKDLMGKLVKVYYDDESDDGVPLRAKTKLEIRTDV